MKLTTIVFLVIAIVGFTIWAALADFTPINNGFRNLDQVQEEIKNIYDNAQSKYFTVYPSTPDVSLLSDGMFVVVAATTGAGAVTVVSRINGVRYKVSELFSF